jgi:calcineurin-like phosphoesterase family protein
MTIWFTSDTHFGHENIIKYCDRPFKNTDHMNDEIVRRWNEAVSPNDIVFHLGDVALGKIDNSLAQVSRLNGYKALVLGNHDRPFMRMGKADSETWWDRYYEVFQEVWHWSGHDGIIVGDKAFNLSHFPYTGDHTPEDRHSEHRLDDEGVPLIHGHTHTTDRLTYSIKGTPQIHVGMDAWNFRPVHEDEIMDIFQSAS